MINIETRYEVNLQYINNGKSTEINSESIKYICIDNDYLDSSFPVIYMNLKIDSNLYDKMLSNINTDTVVLTIGKYNSNKEEKTIVNYIKQEFLYFFASTDYNYAKENDEGTDEENSQESSNNGYRNAYMGLLSLDIINYNKEIFNDIISGNMESIVYKYISNINKVIIEPFDTDKQMNNLLIPPIVGISNLINYLYNISSFYNSYYIFFVDFTKTCYLLSCNGKGVQRKSDDYSSIIINVNGSKDSTSKELGFVKNTKEKCYSVNINYTDYKFNKDLYQDKDYNEIITIDSDGKVSKVKLNTSKNSKGNRIKIFRTLSTNNTKKSNLKFMSGLSNSVVSVTKGDIDSSLFTPEKSYSVRNAEGYNNEDGEYILVGKQEVFRKEDKEYFSLIVNLKLTKTVS